MDPTYDLEELLRRVAEAEPYQIGFKRRIGERDEEWKDPIECMKRLRILRSEAVTIIKELTKENYYKGPEEALDDRHPSPKFSFRTREPRDLTGGTLLYIKLSSPDSTFRVYADSFHENEKPEGLRQDGQDDWGNENE